MASKATPILLWWDYLQDGLKAAVPDWKVIIPSDASIAAYYTQAITYDAPHPAAARLWEEFLYSKEGQNLFLQGNARPIELADMIKAGTANKTWLAELPAAPKGGLTFPTQAQTDAAKATVAANWAAAISGSYSINYSSSTNQYTAQYDSSNTLVSLYNSYKTYFGTNGWMVTNSSSIKSASKIGVLIAATSS